MLQILLTTVCSSPGCIARTLDQPPLPAWGRGRGARQRWLHLELVFLEHVPLDVNRIVAVQMVLVLLVFSHTLAMKKHPVSLLIL